MICPNCGLNLKVEKYYDDHGLVEIIKKCDCGYLYHWAYGLEITDEEMR